MARFEQLMMNNSFPIPPNTQHHLPWRQYGLCNRLWSFSGLRPRSFSHIIVIRDPLFIARNHSFQRWLDFVSFQHQRFTNGPLNFSLLIRACGIQVSSFLWYPVLCKWFRTVLWSTFSSPGGKISTTYYAISTTNYIFLEQSMQFLQLIDFVKSCSFL